MAGEWLQIDCDLPEKPETLRIAALTGEPVEVVIGRMLIWWRWTERHATGPDVPGLDIHGVTHIARGDENFWRAVEMAGWIRFDSDGVHIPGWRKRFSKSAKRRMLAVRRVLRSRATKAQQKRNGTVNQKTVDQTVTVSDQREFDGVSADESDAPAVAELARKLGNRDPKMKLLWQVAALRRVGHLSEADVGDGVQGVTSATRRPKKPVGYFRKILRKRIGHGRFESMLAAVVFAPNFNTGPPPELERIVTGFQQAPKVVPCTAN